MLNLPRWQTLVIIAIVALAGLFALPNPLPERPRFMPHWYAKAGSISASIYAAARISCSRPICARC